MGVRAAYCRAALESLLFVEALRPTRRRAGADADATWASFRGDLTTADRIDLLLRDADAEWPGASADGQRQHRLTPEATSELMRLIRRPRPKRQRPTQLAGPRLLELEREIAAELGTPESGRPALGVFPTAAIWIEPTEE